MPNFIRHTRRGSARSRRGGPAGEALANVCARADPHRPWIKRQAAGPARTWGPCVSGTSRRPSLLPFCKERRAALTDVWAP
nr:unnamed protein product [Digitaria exilis]